MESFAYDASTIRLVDNTGYRPTLGSDYVLLGMVDDYLDRSADRHDDVVERFYPKEKVIVQLFLGTRVRCSQALQRTLDRLCEPPALVSSRWCLSP